MIGLEKLLKRIGRDIAIANVAFKTVAAITPKETPEQIAFDEMWRRWNNVPLSDLRGQYYLMLREMEHGFEKKLPPWRQWWCKSNGRWVQGKRRIVRPIRGIHIRTKGTKDCTLPKVGSK